MPALRAPCLTYVRRMLVSVHENQMSASQPLGFLSAPSIAYPNGIVFICSLFKWTMLSSLLRKEPFIAMEKDLFEPVKAYFESYGYACDGEVNDIDLYMEKDGTSVAVELKLSLDFKAVQQAALRQKITDTVFIGIPQPKNMRSHAFQDKLYLLKRLGIGLIVVSERTHAVEIVNEPVVSELSSFQSRNRKKRRAVSGEFQKRKARNNTGGVHHTKLITSYREDSLLVLDALCELGGEATTKAVRSLSGISKATAILHDNYYGWFENTGRGRYQIREAGYDALEEFETTLRLLKKADPTSRS